MIWGVIAPLMASLKCFFKHVSVMHSFRMRLQIPWRVTTAYDDINFMLMRFMVFTHYNDIIMSTMASQITSLAIVYSTVYSGTDQRKHQSSASLAFAWRIHRWPINYPHKGPVTRRMFPFDDVIIKYCLHKWNAMPKWTTCVKLITEMAFKSIW